MKAIKNQISWMLAALVALLIITVSAIAHPLPGRDTLKFQQRPMDGTVLVGSNGQTQQFWGHDELSTAYSLTGVAGPSPYRGTFMADDFADKFNTPVVHVKWWGSYLDDFINTTMPVNKFLISFEADVPQGAGVPFSHPGQPLLNQIVTRGALSPGSGTFTESLISAGGPPLNENLYEYNAELHLGKEFFQNPDTVYWLKVVALVDAPAGITFNTINPPATVTRWGWHNRDYTIQDALASTPPAVSPGEHLTTFGPAPGIPIWHFQDDAVTGEVVVDHLSTPVGQIMPNVIQSGYQPTRYRPQADGPGFIGQFSKDLAFELYTPVVPEPASAMLMMLGVAGVLSVRRRATTV